MIDQQAQTGGERSRGLPLAAAVFGLQLLLVWMVAERPGGNGWANARKSSVRLLQKDGQGISAVDEGVGADPSLYALPDPRSFSGPAWLLPSPVQFEIPRIRHEARWLPPPVMWGSDFSDFLRTNEVLAVTKLDLPTPPLSQVDLPSGQGQIRSGLRVMGRAASRLQSPIPELPPLPVRSLLPGVEVEVEINADGNVVTARLMDEVVAVTREQQADLILAGKESLSAARKLVFARASDVRGVSNPFARIETVRIVFDWVPQMTQATPP